MGTVPVGRIAGATAGKWVSNGSRRGQRSRSMKGVLSSKASLAEGRGRGIRKRGDFDKVGDFVRFPLEKFGGRVRRSAGERRERENCGGLMPCFISNPQRKTSLSPPSDLRSRWIDHTGPGHAREWSPRREGSAPSFANPRFRPHESPCLASSSAPRHRCSTQKSSTLTRARNRRAPTSRAGDPAPTGFVQRGHSPPARKTAAASRKRCWNLCGSGVEFEGDALFCLPTDCRLF
jgi:hypothetical protein